MKNEEWEAKKKKKNGKNPKNLLDKYNKDKRSRNEICGEEMMMIKKNVKSYFIRNGIKNEKSSKKKNTFSPPCLSNSIRLIFVFDDEDDDDVGG